MYYIKRIIRDEDRELLKKYLSLIKNRIDLNKVYDNFKSGDSQNTELLDFE